MDIGKFISRSHQKLGKRFSGGTSSKPADQVTISDRGRKIAILSRQLSSMMEGGVPLVRCLDVLSEQNEDATLGRVLEDLACKLGQGFAFSKTLSLYPRVFPGVMVHLVATGESTGLLTKVVRRLAELLEAEENLVKQVRGALSYPIFILVLTFVLAMGLFSTVLPGFADFYRDFDVELPMLTQTLMGITAIIRNPWSWILSVPTIYGVVWLVRRSWNIPEHRLVMFRGLIAIPLCGPIVEITCLARYCWVMELTQESGLDLLRSLRLAGEASGAPTLSTDAHRLVRGITDGEGLSDLIALRPDFYTPLLHQMVMMGEESSRLPESFARSAEWFAQDVEGRVQSLQAALEPVMMGAIAFFVGGIILAVFLPLYGLLDKLGV